MNECIYNKSISEYGITGSEIKLNPIIIGPGEIGCTNFIISIKEVGL